MSESIKEQLRARKDPFAPVGRHRQTVTVPCPTCGHPHEVCAVCKGRGYVTESRSYQAAGRNVGYSASVKACPRGCPPPRAML